MANPIDIVHPPLTLEQRFENVMTNLNAAYATLHPGATRDDFKSAVAFKIREMGEFGQGYEVLRLLASLQAQGLPIDHANASIYLSCAYAIQAMQARDDGQPELAASLMVDAYYWCGTLTAVGEAKQVRDAVLSAQGAKGAQAREGRYRPMREWAYKVASGREKWSSRNQAAIHVKNLLDTNPPSRDWPRLASSEAVKTISKWLKEHPDAERLFGKRQKAAASESI